MSFFQELKRRNVFRMGIAYIVVAWVLLQAIDFTLDIISAPNWVMQVFFLAALVGLPVVLIISWVFEMTPEGIKRESEIDRGQSVTQRTGHKLDRTIIISLAIAVVLLLADRFLIGKEASAPSPAVSVAETKAESARDAPPTNAQEHGMRSVAVLPFVNMSSDPEQDYFSDGLSEELLNRLAKCVRQPSSGKPWQRWAYWTFIVVMVGRICVDPSVKMILSVIHEFFPGTQTS